MLLAEKPSLALASCCSVEVVKGALGLRVPGVFETLATLKFAVFRLSRKSVAAFSVSNFLLSSAFRISPEFGTIKSPVILNELFAPNFSISRSRSTSNLTAGLCTRPALFPPGTFRHTTGLKSKPTNQSKVWRVC